MARSRRARCSRSSSSYGPRQAARRDVSPADFVWGAATAAFQIEGATTADGRGESIWDRFAPTPGKVLNGDTGDPACDHYHRWRDDLDLMQSLGLQALPLLDRVAARPADRPRRRPNQKGLDFYRRLVDGLLERGIRPFATLYHWDLPQALAGRGRLGRARHASSASASTREIVVRRASATASRTGSRTTSRGSPAFLGYGLGVQGARASRDWRAARPRVPPPPALARARRRGASAPQGRERADRHHARPHALLRRRPARRARMDGFRNRWFLDPVLRGAYPEDMVELYAPHAGPLDCVEDGDLATISAPIDFLGVNFYHPTRVVRRRRRRRRSCAPASTRRSR